MENPYDIPPDQPIESIPGYTPDFSKMQNQGRYNEILATLIVCTALSTIAVIARMVTRVFVVKRWGWDDYLAVISMLLNFGLTVCYVGELRSGLAFDIFNTSLRTFMLKYYGGWTYWNATFTIILYFDFAAIKLSILMLYLRLLGPNNKILRRGVWVCVAIVVGVLIGTVAGVLAFCKPPAKIWHPEIKGTCNFNANLFLAQAILQVATDLLVLLPPIFVVAKLNAPTTRKFGFLSTLCLGLFVTGIGVARLAMFVVQLSEKQYAVDISYLGTYLVIFEINFGIITICLPAIRQLHHSVKTHVKSSVSKSSKPFSNPSEGPHRLVPLHLNHSNRISGGLSSSKRAHRSSITQLMDGPYSELLDNNHNNRSNATDSTAAVKTWGEGPPKGQILTTTTATVTVRSRYESEDSSAEMPIDDQKSKKEADVGMAV